MLLGLLDAAWTAAPPPLLLSLGAHAGALPPMPTLFGLLLGYPCVYSVAPPTTAPAPGSAGAGGPLSGPLPSDAAPAACASLGDGAGREGAGAAGGASGVAAAAAAGAEQEVARELAARASRCLSLTELTRVALCVRPPAALLACTGPGPGVLPDVLGDAEEEIAAFTVPSHLLAGVVGGGVRHEGGAAGGEGGGVGGVLGAAVQAWAQRVACVLRAGEREGACTWGEVRVRVAAVEGGCAVVL